jgi:hypothetical protein
VHSRQAHRIAVWIATILFSSVLPGNGSPVPKSGYHRLLPHSSAVDCTLIILSYKAMHRHSPTYPISGYAVSDFAHSTNSKKIYIITLLKGAPSFFFGEWKRIEVEEYCWAITRARWEAVSSRPIFFQCVSVFQFVFRMDWRVYTYIVDMRRTFLNVAAQIGKCL